MTLHRKAYENLKEWKNSKNTSKAIIIKGARRVGKSFLAECFAQNEYKSYLLIDFASPKNGTLKIFENYGNKDSLNDFFNQLSVLYGVFLHEHESVIIFDEIQKYPKARELIKYLVADGRYDYIETGSLISIKKNVKDIVIPSEEEPFELHPLDFEEFLQATDDTVTIPFLKDAFENKKPLGNMLKPIMDKFRNYMIVGGMPQAVVEFVESGNIANVEKVKRGIIKLYREDIAKYAEGYVAEATAIFNSIPSLLAHHDKKIKYSSLGEGDRFSSYKDAIHWIADSMVGNLCVGTDEPDIFAGFTVQPSKLKCYMEDTGILLTLAAGENYLTSELYKSFMLGKISVNKGMMTENMIAQILAANNHPLRFYENIVESNGKKTKYEVDFLLRSGDKVVPIEVKSGNIKEHKSLDYYQKKFKSVAKKGIVLTKGDLRVTEDYLYLPLFMAIFL
ncbi:MAG: ATP-binding protein [Treponema sp.]|nr:ATP-binding protein [Treponema sp.]